MQRTLFSAAVFDTLYYLIPLFPQTVHLHQYLRRMLQVAVHHRTAIARSACQPCIHRRFLTEIAGKIDARHIWVAPGRTFNLLPRAVLRTIVYKNDLIWDLLCIQDPVDRIGCLLYHFFFVVSW